MQIKACYLGKEKISISNWLVKKTKLNATYVRIKEVVISHIGSISLAKAFTFKPKKINKLRY